MVLKSDVESNVFERVVARQVGPGQSEGDAATTQPTMYDSDAPPLKKGGYTFRRNRSVPVMILLMVDDIVFQSTT